MCLNKSFVIVIVIVVVICMKIKKKKRRRKTAQQDVCLNIKILQVSHLRCTYYSQLNLIMKISRNRDCHKSLRKWWTFCKSLPIRNSHNTLKITICLSFKCCPLLMTVNSGRQINSTSKESQKISDRQCLQLTYWAHY